MVVSGSRGSGKKTVLELIAGVILTGNNGKMFVPPHLRLLHVAKEPQSIPELDIFSIMAAKLEVFMGVGTAAIIRNGLLGSRKHWKLTTHPLQGNTYQLSLASEFLAISKPLCPKSKR